MRKVPAVPEDSILDFWSHISLFIYEPWLVDGHVTRILDIKNGSNE